MIYCFLQKEIDNIRKIAFMSVIRCRSCLFILADLYTIYPFFQYLWVFREIFRHKKGEKFSIYVIKNLMRMFSTWLL